MRKGGLSCGGQGRFRREGDEMNFKGQAVFSVAVAEACFYGESLSNPTAWLGGQGQRFGDAGGRYN